MIFTQTLGVIYPAVHEKKMEGLVPATTSSTPLPSVNGSTRVTAGKHYYLVRDDSMLKPSVLARIFEADEKEGATKTKVRESRRFELAAVVRDLIEHQRQLNKKYIKLSTSCKRAMKAFHPQWR